MLQQTEERQGGAVVGDPAHPGGVSRATTRSWRRARRQAASYLDDLQRLKAEFDNYRKRTMKEQTRLIEMAAAGTVAQLLGVLDHFDLAMYALPAGRRLRQDVKGVEMVHSELKRSCDGPGLEIIEPKGKPFDPNVHEAVRGEGDGSGEMVVGEVLRNGYKFKETVLRPAMVKVTQDASAAVERSQRVEEKIQ